MDPSPVTGAVVGALLDSPTWGPDDAQLAARRADRADVKGICPSSITRWGQGERSVNLEQLRILVGRRQDRALLALRALVEALGVEGIEVTLSADSLRGKVGDTLSEMADVDDASRDALRFVARDVADGRLDDVDGAHAHLDRVEQQLTEARASLPPRAARRGA